jgi:hypothetical protein
MALEQRMHLRPMPARRGRIVTVRKHPEPAATRRPVRAADQLLRLQQSVGNQAVVTLLRQPAPEVPGWKDADPAVDPAVGFAWNIERRAVGAVGRYPIQGLLQGVQEPWLSGASKKLTRESAAGGRAIALVPGGLDPGRPVRVLLHLHGYAETAGRPYAGWRARRDTHKVRDVEHDRIAQQIEATGDPQIIGLLPQGGEKSQFSKSSGDPYNTFASDAYINEVLAKLVRVGALASEPKEHTVTLSAHSGGGHTIRSMLEFENRQRGGRPTKGLSPPPTALSEVVLFDAINNDAELETARTWVTGKLDGLLAVLSDPGKSTADKDQALAATPRLRGYYAEGGFYVERYKALDGAIRLWFVDHGDALGAYADQVWARFQVVPVPGLGKTKPEKHEAIVRGHALGDAKAPAAGTLTDALNAPVAATPRPMTAAEVSAKGAVTSSRLADLDDAGATAFRRAVYDEQLRQALADPDKQFSPGLAPGDIGSVEGVPIHKVAEADAQALLDRARRDRDAAKRAGNGRAVACRSLGVGNAYRDPERDFRAWQDSYAKHYGKSAAARAQLRGGKHGQRAVDLLARRLASFKAVPGFSNHTKGLAIDFVTVQNGVSLGANSDQKDAWRASWFHRWLVDHAPEFHFSPLATEEWHWDHAAGSPAAVSDTAAGAAGRAEHEVEPEARPASR